MEEGTERGGGGLGVRGAEGRRVSWALGKFFLSTSPILTWKASKDWASGTSGYGSLYLQGPTALASLYANRVSQVWRIVHCIFSGRSLWMDRVS